MVIIGYCTWQLPEKLLKRYIETYVKLKKHFFQKYTHIDYSFLRSHFKQRQLISKLSERALKWVFIRVNIHFFPKDTAIRAYSNYILDKTTLHEI